MSTARHSRSRDMGLGDQGCFKGLECADAFEIYVYKISLQSLSSETNKTNRKIKIKRCYQPGKLRTCDSVANVRDAVSLLSVRENGRYKSLLLQATH